MANSEIEMIRAFLAASPAPQSIAERLLGRSKASPAPLPSPATVPQETRPERLPFRAVLRRASA